MSAPADLETSVRRERPLKEEENEEFEVLEGSKEDGENREKTPSAKRRKVPKSKCNGLHLREDNFIAAMA